MRIATFNVNGLAGSEVAVHKAWKMLGIDIICLVFAGLLEDPNTISLVEQVKLVGVVNTRVQKPLEFAACYLLLVCIQKFPSYQAMRKPNDGGTIASHKLERTQELVDKEHIRQERCPFKVGVDT